MEKLVLILALGLIISILLLTFSVEHIPDDMEEEDYDHITL